jgi:hypothetical protein
VVTHFALVALSENQSNRGARSDALNFASKGKKAIQMQTFVATLPCKNKGNSEP